VGRRQNQRGRDASFRLSYNGEKISKTGYPQNYTCKNVEFKVSLGYIPTLCTKPGKAIKYAAQGG
jgi:hypothetical protein